MLKWRLQHEARKNRKSKAAAPKPTRSKGLKRLRGFQQSASEATFEEPDSKADNPPAKKNRKSPSSEARPKAKAAKASHANPEGKASKASDPNTNPAKARGPKASKASDANPKGKAATDSDPSTHCKPSKARGPKASKASRCNPKAKASKASGPKPKSKARKNRDGTSKRKTAPESGANGKRKLRCENGSQAPDPERVEVLLDMLRKFTDVGYLDTGLDLEEQRFRPTVHLNIYWCRNHVGVSIKKKGKLQDAGCNFTSKTTTIATHLQLANWCVSRFN